MEDPRDTRGVAAIPLRGISTRHLRRVPAPTEYSRDTLAASPPPRNIHAATSPRPRPHGTSAPRGGAAFPPPRKIRATATDRAPFRYNFFGDQMAPFIMAMAFNQCQIIEWFCMKMALSFNLWRVKHENTAWHTQLQEQDEFEIPGWEDLKGSSHDAFMMNQRITSETFRFKFLNYNRAWLIDQLPSILTPRTLRRSRPYLINQFTRILNQLNQDISSDSEEDEGKFGPVALKANSRQIVRWWLAQARRRMRLREVVQPLISKARGTQCENCLSRRQLQVECVAPLEVLAAQFDQENPDQEFDQVPRPRGKRGLRPWGTRPLLAAAAT